MFWRRVDGLLAKNCARGDGMGWDGGGDDNSGAPIKNYAPQSISGKGRNQERQKRQIEGRGHTIGRLVKMEISEADAQDGQSPPPNPTPIANMYYSLYIILCIDSTCASLII
jgi:hypothetical protein